MNEQPAARGPVPATVLYVDDQQINTLVMQSLFQHRPALRLVVASDGQQALNVARFVRPVLLLLDLHLPDCHGTELLQRLRGVDGFADVPAVAVTADQYFEAAGSDFDEVWIKPLDVRAALRRIDRWVAPNVGAAAESPFASQAGSR